MEPDAGDPSLVLRRRGKKVPLALVPDAKMRRPEPPERLAPVEREIWEEITQSVRADWFRGGSEFLLELYVQVLAQQRQIQGWLQEVEPGSARYAELLKLQIMVTRTASALATKLRLSPRSNFDRYQVRAVPTLARPWQDDPPAA